jgi:hypothetical protein
MLFCVEFVAVPTHSLSCDSLILNFNKFQLSLEYTSEAPSPGRTTYHYSIASYGFSNFSQFNQLSGLVHADCSSEGKGPLPKRTLLTWLVIRVAGPLPAIPAGAAF